MTNKNKQNVRGLELRIENLEREIEELKRDNNIELVQILTTATAWAQLAAAVAGIIILVDKLIF